MNVWIVLWHHQYGTDFWANKTRETADRTLATELSASSSRDMLSDEDHEKFFALIKEAKYREATQLYFEKVESEYHEIEEREIQE